MSEPAVFVPFTGILGAPRVIREARVTRDLTMPRRDWSKLEAPAYERIQARSICAAEFGSQHARS